MRSILFQNIKNIQAAKINEWYLSMHKGIWPSWKKTNRNGPFRLACSSWRLDHFMAEAYCDHSTANASRERWVAGLGTCHRTDARRTVHFSVFPALYSWVAARDSLTGGGNSEF